MTLIEPLYLDHQPSRIAGDWTVLAGSTYDIDLRAMAPLFEVICKNETALAETFAFALTQEIMDDIENKTERELFFKPATIISDEAMSFKRSIVSFWDANYLRDNHKTCQMHYMSSVNRKSSHMLGSPNECQIFKKLADNMLRAVSPEMFDRHLTHFKNWQKERPDRKRALEPWIDFWERTRNNSKTRSNAFHPLIIQDFLYITIL